MTDLQNLRLANAAELRETLGLKERAPEPEVVRNLTKSQVRKMQAIQKRIDLLMEAMWDVSDEIADEGAKARMGEARGKLAQAHATVRRAFDPA